MYYGIVAVAVVMFGVQFLLNDKYRKESGTDSFSVFLFSFIGALAGVICLAVINVFDFSVTPFTLIMAFAAALNSVLCSICTLRSLEKVNLSVYSLFSMLGGMVLPFFAGILFYGEALTVGNIACTLLIGASLALTLKSGKGRGGEIYYVGVFVFNGMSGVLSKIYSEAAFPKVSSKGYSLWIAIMSLAICALALLILIGKRRRVTWTAFGTAFGGGVLNRVANYMLLIALAFLPASVQYPFVTGGVIVVSTVISVLTGQKPSKKEIIAVALAFIGILALFLSFELVRLPRLL